MVVELAKVEIPLGVPSSSPRSEKKFNRRRYETRSTTQGKGDRKEFLRSIDNDDSAKSFVYIHDTKSCSIAAGFTLVWPTTEWENGSSTCTYQHAVTTNCPKICTRCVMLPPFINNSSPAIRKICRDKRSVIQKIFFGPWLRCVGPLQANYVLREIQEGSCSMRAGPRSVVAKALRSGYYLPTMHTDARNLIRECNDCQVHRPVPRNPQEKLTPITSTWPFYKWGIDIAGLFPKGLGKVKFLIVAMDYFTKWIEERPVATITEARVKKFVWNNIICRFGLPGEIVSNNEKQFRDNPFKERSLGERIKARLRDKNKNWVEEISHILWAYRTMIKSSNGEIPFSLTYGAEAVIPAEIGMPTLRTAKVDMVALGISLDLLEEKRE
uniref:Reverse transcriptase domain-containing protein n=1 Tax=Tanacetum cinerariifolium TaxID=118510 RepID=A0A6L2K1T4_TANCI|nr:reverse transcriptase domain-containing protein [Tanacetum cinerariifolium]